MGVLDAPRVSCYTQECREKNDEVLVKINESKPSKQVQESSRSGTHRVSTNDLDAFGSVYGSLQGPAKLNEDVFPEGRNGDFDRVLLVLGAGANYHSEEVVHV